MQKMKDILFGCAVGDALGVPYEFKKRNSFECSEFVGYGSHYQPRGTWSDDTSMTLCLADSIVNGFSYDDLAYRFLSWYFKGEYTANGDVFDIGIGTRNALEKIKNGVNPISAGGQDLYNNGNGSLMCISPIIFLTKKLQQKERFELCKNVSSITHGHRISIYACFLLEEFLYQLTITNDVKKSFLEVVKIKDGLENNSEFKDLNENLMNYSVSQIHSSGFCVDTLIASLWCLLTTNNYKDAVLKAVNLGDDTDTTGAVVGAVASFIYGYENIPKEWIMDLRNKELINSICNNFRAIN